MPAKWPEGFDPVYIDFETFWTDEYSLKKMSVEEYVSDNRFEILGMGYWSERTGPGFAWGEPGAKAMLDDLRVGDDRVVTIAHNMAFDGYIASRRLGATPSRPFCTIGMARFTSAGRQTWVSLKALAKYLGLQDKGDIVQFKGLHLEDFGGNGRLAGSMSDYCLNDIDLTRQVVSELGPQLTPEARDFICLSIRMYIDPCLTLDRELLEKYRAELEAKQDEGVERLRRIFNVGCREEFLTMIRSRDTFVGLLRELGAEVPMKESAAKKTTFDKAMAEAQELLSIPCEDRDEKTRARAVKALKTIKGGVLTPALAKSDLGFQALMDSDDEDIAELCRLRAENNSSIALSRADAFLGVARRGGLLPVPLSPYRTQTGRYAAGNEGGGRTDGFNLQNLPKRTGDLMLRKAIKAPAGTVLIAGDSSQIEARVGAWLAGQADLLDTFRRGDDPYVEMGALIFGHPYEEIFEKAKELKIPEFVFMRNVGKEVILSSQYNISGETFGRRLLQQKVRLAENVDDHYAEAQRINRLYRDRFKMISRTWWDLDRFLRAFVAGASFGGPFPVCRALEPTTICASDKDGLGTLIIELPNKFPLVYPDLRVDGREVSYLQIGGFTARPVRINIYGGKLFNNLTQGMAFAVLAHQAVELSRKFRLVANVHDSWVVLARDPDCDSDQLPEWIKALPPRDEAKFKVQQILRTPPDWARDVPLDAEVKSGHTYEVA
ncbi:MAG: hypothetical protein LBQ12_00915 [Deltaproteobacteria bacterium]|jgi:DNA polymerase|nr:hypothetical protein [Deltaproteobacteria bacterium]